MSVDSTSELANFNRFIGERLNTGLGETSPEEMLDLWRAEHPCEEEFEENVAALREALEDMKAGVPGIPLEEFHRQFQERILRRGK